jgi:1-acyl-sn-glycerol-3-phosphate acyltransferase
MQRLRSVLFDVYLVLWTLLLSPSVPVMWLLHTPATGVRRLSRFWVRGVLAGLGGIAGLRHQERGRENIPPGPCLFVANHQSPWETIAAAVLIPDVAIVAKKELLRIPAFGWALKASPMIMIDREAGPAALKQMIAEGRAAVAQGRSVLVFPEGTRKQVTARVEFRRGFELLYRTLGVPVVPVALNSGLFWGRGQKFKRRGMITIAYLPALPAGLATNALHDRLVIEIQREKDVLAGELSGTE